MIPFALKVVWFSFALIGLVQCWITLIYFGRKAGGLWARLYYCVFVTLLEGIFCIGIIWRMDPSRMPRHFCIGQVITISLASFALTGVYASLTLAYVRAVLRPGALNTGRAVLAWHPRYIPLVILFPIAACVTHVTLLVHNNAVKPSLSDDLHCDATDPIWLRFVGYAGVPVIFTIPFLILSVIASFRMHHVRRFHGEEYEDDYVPTDTLSNGRSAFRAWFKKSPSVPPSPTRTSAVQPDDYPLHKHPFPVINPLTGGAYSPPDDEHNPPITNPPVSLRISRFFPGRRPQSLQPHERSASGKSNTPDSVMSSTMPVFAPNPWMPPTKNAARRVNRASMSSVQPVQYSEAGDVQVGLAITTGDSPRVSTEENHGSDEDVVMGLAVTTDEPERIPTPITRPRIPSPLKVELLGSHDTPDADDAQDIPPPRDSNLHDEPGPHENGRSYETILSSIGQSLHSNDSIAQVLSQPTVSGYPSRADHGSQPFLSLTSGSSLQSLRTPDNGVDPAFDIVVAQRTSDDRKGDQDENDEEADTMEWEDDDGDYNPDMPSRTFTRRDPRERLGVYNPTPPTGPTPEMRARRRQTLQKDMHPERSTKLRNVMLRMIIFQIMFFTIQLLACLSSLMDVARRRITPFGTQHVALILVAWAPLCIFGVFRSFRHFLFFFCCIQVRSKHGI